MAWMEGLRELNDSTVESILEYWEGYIPGCRMNQAARNRGKSLVRRFGSKEVCAAMDIAAEQYLKFDENGNAILPSAENAWHKIAGICRVRRNEKQEPDMQELYYIRGIIRNRLSGGYFCAYKAMSALKAARASGVELSKLGEIARNASSWTKFCCLLEEAGVGAGGALCDSEK
jgi:hypothetical protein